tara:strand:- start:513 stop:668 length:156 start_codon:yes stop_codon:yes gene_type:complete
MCGRYILTSKIDEINKKFSTHSKFALESNWNVAPGFYMPIILSKKKDNLKL